jgi:hypothetical protein
VPYRYRSASAAEQEELYAVITKIDDAMADSGRKRESSPFRCEHILDGHRLTVLSRRATRIWEGWTTPTLLSNNSVLSRDGYGKSIVIAARKTANCFCRVCAWRQAKRMIHSHLRAAISPPSKWVLRC